VLFYYGLFVFLQAWFENIIIFFKIAAAWVFSWYDEAMNISLVVLTALAYMAEFGRVTCPICQLSCKKLDSHYRHSHQTVYLLNEVKQGRRRSSFVHEPRGGQNLDLGIAKCEVCGMHIEAEWAAVHQQGEKRWYTRASRCPYRQADSSRRF